MMTKMPKFRAWDKFDKVMRDVTLLDYNHNFVGYSYPVFMKSTMHMELMQSTGLFDKNGKEIFEGDIVKRYKSPFHKAKWEYQIETVLKEKASLLLGREFGKNFGTIPFDSPFARSELLEVIGNIYENQELLEEEND